MDANQLSQLIDRRLHLLQSLMEMGHKQTAAIRDGRMSDLMRILSEKQPPLSELAAIAQQLKAAAGDDPEKRIWPDPAARDRCRRHQQVCEQLHLDLLAMEAECESTLSKSRDEIQQRLERVDSGRQVANSYARQAMPVTGGGTLDLSSDS